MGAHHIRCVRTTCLGARVSFSRIALGVAVRGRPLHSELLLSSATPDPAFLVLFFRLHSAATPILPRHTAVVAVSDGGAGIR